MILVPINVIKESIRGKIVPVCPSQLAAALNVPATSMTPDAIKVMAKIIRLQIKPAIKAHTELIRISDISIFLGPNDIVDFFYDSNTRVKELTE